MNYRKYIDSIEFKNKYEKEDLLIDELKISSSKNIDLYYAPFDYINLEADIIVIGITPGWTQMELAYRTYLLSIKNGFSRNSAFKKVKEESSFAGSMRKNLISMLDEIGLNKKLDLESTSQLFESNNGQMHSTSILKNAVFVSGKNYSGSNPPVVNNMFLYSEIKRVFIPEINNFTNKLIVPLGKNVNDVLNKLLVSNQLNSNCFLSGFPHPSGANGHRKKDFEKNKAQMISKVNNWTIS